MPQYQIHEPANRITLAGGALRCDHKRDVERAYTIDPAFKKMANRKRLVSIPGRSSIQGRRSTSHPRHSPKLGERPQYSARSLSRRSLRVFGTTFKNFKAEDQVNMNLDDLERLLRNLMLSLGHASEMLPLCLSFFAFCTTLQRATSMRPEPGHRL